ncbi:transporter substrate-binding domain-containing protein [Cysteiniphilum halobium]|uniref:transporter substrate-binding domain-containing protein n=1 Tax=Cysteiniphilum halobium TaxID=2219059 RepID=UPI003F8747D6
MQVQRVKKIIFTSCAATAMVLFSNSALASQKLLRVCTTGDYPPLTSYDASTGEYKGFAITVAKEFAHKIKRKVEFVHSTWSTLSDDLKKKCDIAMGGISYTPKRKQVFYLSTGVLSNQKAPIFSKENESTFKNLASIDQQDVTVIENKGGTNQPFAESYIRHAKVTILPTNAEVYACLNKYPQKKIVMFTDKIEVQYRADMQGSLLSDNGLKFDLNSIPGNTVSQKVFMTNKTKDGKWLIKKMDSFYKHHKNDFNQWYQDALKAQYPVVKASCPF